MTRDEVRRWVEAYLVAWNTSSPSDIAGLFTEDAVYVTGPFDEPWEGRDAIVASWIERKDEPGDTRFEYEIVAVEGDRAVIEGTTDYLTDGYRFANVWFVDLDGSGMCRRFVEYWVQRTSE